MPSTSSISDLRRQGANSDSSDVALRFRHEKALRRDPRVTRELLGLALLAASYGDLDGRDIRPSVVRLAEDMGYALDAKGDCRHVRKLLRQLVDLGYLVVVRKGRPGHATEYRLALPAAAAPVDTATEPEETTAVRSQEHRLSTAGVTGSGEPTTTTRPQQDHSPPTPRGDVADPARPVSGGKATKLQATRQEQPTMSDRCRHQLERIAAAYPEHRLTLEAAERALEALEADAAALDIHAPAQALIKRHPIGQTYAGRQGARLTAERDHDHQAATLDPRNECPHHEPGGLILVDRRGRREPKCMECAGRVIA